MFRFLFFVSLKDSCCVSAAPFHFIANTNNLMWLSRNVNNFKNLNGFRSTSLKWYRLNAQFCSFPFRLFKEEKMLNICLPLFYRYINGLAVIFKFVYFQVNKLKSLKFNLQFISIFILCAICFVLSSSSSYFVLLIWSVRKFPFFQIIWKFNQFVVFFSLLPFLDLWG